MEEGLEDNNLKKNDGFSTQVGDPSSIPDTHMSTRFLPSTHCHGLLQFQGPSELF